jgi:hypothetical protein
MVTDSNFTYTGHQEKYWLHQRAESQLVILTSKNLRWKWLNLLRSPHPPLDRKREGSAGVQANKSTNSYIDKVFKLSEESTKKKQQ